MVKTLYKLFLPVTSEKLLKAAPPVVQKVFHLSQFWDQLSRHSSRYIKTKGISPGCPSVLHSSGCLQTLKMKRGTTASCKLHTKLAVGGKLWQLLQWWTKNLTAQSEYQLIREKPGLSGHLRSTLWKNYCFSFSPCLTISAET